MPRTTTALLLAALALAGGAAATGGCSSTEKRAETASSDILATQFEVQQGDAAVAVALGKLDALTHRDPTDLEDRFDEYQDSLKGLDDAASKVRDRADRMRASGDKYFDEWSHELAGAGEEKADAHAQRLKDYAAVRQGSQDLREAYGPFVAQLRNIRDTLKQGEITQERVKAIAPNIRQAKDMGLEVHKDCLALEDRLRAFAEKVQGSGGR